MALPLSVVPEVNAHLRQASSGRLASTGSRRKTPICARYLPRLHFQKPLTPMIRLRTLRRELRPTVRLALPLVLAEIGWMTMGIVDTVMVGHLPESARAIGAVSISSNLFNVVAFFGGGLLIGLFPLLLYFAVRRCIQAMNLVRPVAFALITANIINALFNWILIYGKWGAPAMGVVGSGWSTALSRVYLAVVLVGYLLWYDRRHRTDLLKTPVDLDFTRIRRLIILGLPAAVQITLEVSVFALATALIGRLGAVALASHQIALNTIAFTYMVPLGISSAAAVRVGQAIGRREPVAAGESGDTAIFLGAAFMTLAAAVLLVFPRWIALMYTPDEVVIRSTSLLLAAG